MIDRAAYTDRATTIERTCARLGAPARIGTISVLPGFVDYEVLPAAGIRVSQIRTLRDDIALALSDETTLIRQNGHLSLQHARVPAAVVRADTLIPRMPDLPYTALLGIDETGATLTARLSSSEVAHVLIAGTTGSGKTQLARTIVSSLVLRHRPRELGIIMIDPKRITSDQFAQSIASHLLLPVAHDVGDAAAALQRVLHAMSKRTRAEPRIVIYCDEVADMATDERILNALQRIGAVGRELGVHLIACTQKPTAAAVGSLLKANLPLRLVGRVTSATEASTAAGLPGTGAERLSGRGDFLAVAGGRVVRFQAALPPSLPVSATPAPATMAIQLLAEQTPAPPDVATIAPDVATIDSARDPIDGAPAPAPVDSLVTRIADYLSEFPDASLNEISRQCAGKPYAGNSHCARIKAAVELARVCSTTTGATTTGEKPAVEAETGDSGSSRTR